MAPDDWDREQVDQGVGREGRARGSLREEFGLVTGEG